MKDRLFVPSIIVTLLVGFTCGFLFNSAHYEVKEMTMVSETGKPVATTWFKIDTRSGKMWIWNVVTSEWGVLKASE